jgi:nucleoid-associated protein YgaU
MKKKILTSMILATGVAFSAPSMAVLNIYSNEALLAEKAEKKGQYSFNQEGLSPEKTRVVQANVNNMPLEMALETLTNNQWKIIVNEEAKNMPVSFEGGQSWPYILERLSMDNNLKTNIDWKYRILTVFSPEAREKAIADRREELIQKEAMAMANAKKQLEKAKEEYKEYVKENTKTHSGNEKGGKTMTEEYHHGTGHSQKDDYENNTMNSGESKKGVDTNNQKEMASDSMNMMEEYLHYKETQKGYPFERLVDGAPYQYTVEKGDTLWDISEFFLNNPWFWPEIWYINPQVENPHLIYPGENLMIDPSKEDK